jgi:hypothetical protein
MGEGGLVEQVVCFGEVSADFVAADLVADAECVGILLLHEA